VFCINVWAEYCMFELGGRLGEVVVSIGKQIQTPHDIYTVPVVLHAFKEYLHTRVGINFSCMSDSLDLSTLWIKPCPSRFNRRVS
jgi:hypothetical protein